MLFDHEATELPVGSKMEGNIGVEDGSSFRIDLLVDDNKKSEIKSVYVFRVLETWIVFWVEIRLREQNIFVDIVANLAR